LSPSDLHKQTGDERFELLVNAVTDYAIYMLDPAGRIATWNAGAARLKGYSAEEITGEHFSRFFTAEDLAADLPARAMRVAAREGRFEAEGWRVRKDGQRIWVNAILDPIRDRSGNLIGYAKITRDMTDRKAAEKAVWESEQRFQLLVGSVTDYAIYMLDPQGHIATWNAGARRFKGYEADEIIGEHFSRFFTAEDKKVGKPGKILRAAATEGRFEAEGWRVRKDGTLFLAHVVVDAIHNNDGDLVGFAKITRDVTERRKRERELFESEQRFRLLVEGVRDYAIYMLDKQGIITNWNSGARTIKGYSADEAVGKHFSIFYTEQDRAASLPARALETSLRSGKYETEAWRVRKDGSLFWASVVIDPIFNEAGEHIGFAKITRDMSERKRVEEELEEARTALLQSQKLQALGELTGGIAHDFNNLMTVVQGSTELLLTQPDLPEEKRRRYLESIAATAKRATTLTSHLLAFSRKRALRPEVVDLNVRLDAFQEVLSRTLGSRIKVVTELNAEDARVELDLTELETAVLNAAVNSRDAMPDGGRLTIASKPWQEDGRDLIALEITDTGTGMAPDLVERVFEPFFTTKPVGQGTGLGLSQIHGFAAQAGGRAELSSSPGEGTTVRILLPRSAKAFSASSDDQILTTIPAGLRVLLVEDNHHVLQFAEHVLRDLGCEVIPASDAQEANALLDSCVVDLVFSDVVMPGMSGVDFARKLREDRPDLPVLLASGYSEQTVGHAAAEFNLLSKPYGAGSLSNAISELLRHKRDLAA
jgi:PAS domain S-box-containing protein